MNGKIEQHQQAVIVDPDVTILERSEVTHIGKCTRGVNGISRAAGKASTIVTSITTVSV